MSDAPASVAIFPRRKRPVLVVDDEPEMLYSLKNLLRREFEVYTAGSGAEGIRVLEEHEIHVVMTDQRMPEMTGVQFLSRMKTQFPKAMRMIFTGYADVKTVIDAINQGNVFRYVTKPWDPEELLHSLREAGERYDQIISRNKLLHDLRDYEARCIAYADGLLKARLGQLTEEGTTLGRSLFNEGKALSARVDATLQETLREPMV